MFALRFQNQEVWLQKTFLGSPLRHRLSRELPSADRSPCWGGQRGGRGGPVSRLCRRGSEPRRVVCPVTLLKGPSSPASAGPGRLEAAGSLGRDLPTSLSAPFSRPVGVA